MKYWTSPHSEKYEGGGRTRRRSSSVSTLGKGSVVQCGHRAFAVKDVRYESYWYTDVTSQTDLN